MKNALAARVAREKQRLLCRLLTAFNREARVNVPVHGSLVLTNRRHLEGVPFSGVRLRCTGNVKCDGSLEKNQLLWLEHGTE